MTTRRRLIVAAYRLALLLYPRAFRDSYADELAALFEAELREPTASSARVARRLLAVVPNAAGERSTQFLQCCRSVLTDLRFATRAVVRQPRTSVLVVVVLAVVVGATTAVSSLVEQTLLRPPPYSDPERIVLLWGRNESGSQIVRDVIAGSTFVELEAAAPGLAHAAAFVTDEFALRENERPEVRAGVRATVGLFDALGTEALVGRLFDDRDMSSGGQLSMVLSYGFWQERFAGDRSAVGRQVRVDDGLATIVGVLPHDFAFLFPADAYLPLYRDQIAQDSYTHYHYWALGKLAETATAAHVGEQLNGELARIATRDPRMARWRIDVEPLQDARTLAVRPALLALLAGSGFALLLAVVNVATVLLVQSTAGGVAWSVRAALGGAPARMARQLLLEGALYGIAATALALPLAAGVRYVLAALAPERVAIPGSAAQIVPDLGTFDLRSVGIAGLLAIAAAFVCAMPGAWRTLRQARGAFVQHTRGASLPRRTARTLDGLLAVEVVLTTVLVLGAVVSARSLAGLAAVDLGIDDRGLLAMYVGDLGRLDTAERNAYYRGVELAVRGVAGVDAAAWNDYVPFQNEDDFEGVIFEDRPPPAPGQGVREEWRRISAAYFETAGMEIVSGRGLEEADFDSAEPVVVLNQAFVRRHFEGRDPVGEYILITWAGDVRNRIVGVVNDVRERGPGEAAPPMMYVPYRQDPRPLMALFVRTREDPARMAATIREAIWSVDAAQPIQQPLILADLTRATLGIPRLSLTVVGALAATSIALATLGVLGVVGFVQRTRRRDHSIRLALGATVGELRRETTVRLLALTGGAVAMGFGLAVPLLGAAQALLYGVRATDAVSLSAVAVVMLGAVVAGMAPPLAALARIRPEEVLHS